MPFSLASALNNFTKPNITMYPNLIMGSAKKEVYDFTEPNKNVYYYNIIGSEILFKIKDRIVRLSIKNVGSIGEKKEYALVELKPELSSSIYINLIEKETVTVELFDELVKLRADSIIDGDNIEYLLIKGVNEVSFDDTQVIKEEKIDRAGVITNEEKPEVFINKEIPKKRSLDLKVIVPALNLIVLFILLIYFFKDPKKRN